MKQIFSAMIYDVDNEYLAEWSRPAGLVLPSRCGGSENRKPRNPPKFTQSNVYYQYKSTLCNKINLYEAKII